MKFEPFSFSRFPDYDESIDGVVNISGDMGNTRVHMIDVQYQEGRIIRFLIPQTLEEGEAPWGGPLDSEDISFWKTARKYPIIVHVQGSGWLQQDMNDHIFDFMPIVMAGYVIAIVQYHEAPGSRFPQQVIDTKRAIRFIAAHAAEYPIDMKHLYLSGDSSGGHTMLLAFFTYNTEEFDDEEVLPLPKLSGGIDLYGVTDFATFDDWWSVRDPQDNTNIEALFGPSFKNPANLKCASPVNYVRKELTLAPLLIIHGSKDTVVPFTQSKEIYLLMKKYGYETRLVRVMGGDNGGLVFFCDATYRELLKFLNEATIDRKDGNSVTK